MDYSQKQLIDLDNNFNFYEFLEGAKEAFKIIVSAYKAKKLDNVKELLSNEVFDKFNNSITSDKKEEKFSITQLKASILNIEVVKKVAKIKVEFFSNQENLVNSKLIESNNIKDIWTFEKDMNDGSFIWTLIEVGEE